VLVELDGARLLTDPVLRGRLAHLRWAGSPVPAVPQEIDAVLVSHVHWDHLDVPSLARLGRRTRLLVPRGAGGLLRRRRFRDVEELRAGGEALVGRVTVEAVPAVHEARRLPLGPLADSLGFVLSGSQRVYFGGDTDLFDGMASLRPLDVALVPISGWGPKTGPGHLDPERAARALTLLEPRVAVPIHWGTLHRIGVPPPPPEAPAREFARLAGRIAPNVEVRVLRPGERTTVETG
jgi:L-ascorbate metabolism protein UlaG (beta-lactamase superfamily)